VFWLLREAAAADDRSEGRAEAENVASSTRLA
jgi:hypothetical protein